LLSDNLRHIAAFQTHHLRDYKESSERFPQSTTQDSMRSSASAVVARTGEFSQALTMKPSGVLGKDIGGQWYK
jgi:hypothetical protein